MNNWFKNLRLKKFFITRSLGYTKDFTDILYKVYLNHNKIIHYRKGYPVYSLFTPALFSKPSANFIARMIYGNIQNRNLPNMMTYAVTDICDATCKHCSFFEAIEDKSKKVLELSEGIDLIKQAQDLGVSLINFTGGEPLLKKDLPALIKSVDKNLSAVNIFTNGSLLKEKVKELKDAGLDGVYISIDFADPIKHDLFRKKEGLFEKAFEGIQLAKKLGLTTGISCTLTPESYMDGEMEKIIELAKKTGVHEVLLFDALPSGRFKGREDLVDNFDWVEEMIAKCEKYNKDSSYPGVVAVGYVLSHKSTGCSCGTSYFYASPYGDIRSCDFNNCIYGSIREKPLYKIWNHLTNKKEFSSSKWGGCKVKDSEFLKIMNETAPSINTCGCN